MRIAPLLGLLTISAFALTGCGRKERVDAVPSVAALEDDPILLSRVIGNCNAQPAAANNPECINARAAFDRRSAGDQAAREKKAEADFEKAREARRRAEDAARLSEQAKQKGVSAYDLPVEGADDKPAPPAAP